MNSRFFCFVCFWDSTFKWDHSVDLLLISISLIKEQYPFKNRTAFITNQRANMIQWITTRVGIRSLDSQVCLQVTAHGLNTSMSFTDCSLKFPHLSEGGELFFICNLRGRISISYTSVQFIHSVVSNSLWPQGLQHARLPCPSPTPGACSNSCPSSRWCHPTISSSIVSFSSCLQSFPASGSFPMSQLFASGGQSVGASASASVLPINIHSWFPLGLIGLISLQSKGLPRVFSNITVQKHQFFGNQPSLWSNSHVRA